MTSPSLPALLLRIRARTALCALLVVCVVILAACGGNSNTPNATKSNGKVILRVAAQAYDFAQSGFNPYK
ncbi:MAG: hypothetical protein NVS2B12_30650 [Ktedonobacteraceae bacterium]